MTGIIVIGFLTIGVLLAIALVALLDRWNL